MLDRCRILCWIDVGYIHLLQCGTCKKFQYDKVTTKRKSWLRYIFVRQLYTGGNKPVSLFFDGALLLTCQDSE